MDPREQVSNWPEEMIIGVIAGSFDLLHAGHIIALEEAKQNCDVLYVLLQTDPAIDRPGKNKPVQSMFERWIQLDACKHVDGIIPYDTEKDLENILCTHQFNVRFLDEEYVNKQDEITAPNECEIVYLYRNHSYSSSELRKRIYNAELDSIIPRVAEVLAQPLPRDFGR